MTDAPVCLCLCAYELPYCLFFAQDVSTREFAYTTKSLWELRSESLHMSFLYSRARSNQRTRVAWELTEYYSASSENCFKFWWELMWVLWSTLMQLLFSFDRATKVEKTLMQIIASQPSSHTLILVLYRLNTLSHSFHRKSSAYENTIVFHYFTFKF
jgi:hypothetical protein